MGDKPRIGVSACVLGEPVRYHGGHCRDRQVLPELARHVEFIAVCPEVESGLGTPRESMRLQSSPSGPRLVGGQTGKDETSRLTMWSKARVRAMEDLALDGFILKKGSPSCGMERVRVYREEDSTPRNDGVGIFARELITRYPALAIEEDGRLQDAGLREHFVTRVFASRRWRTFTATRPDHSALLAFHAHEETLLRAHDPERARALGLLAARSPGPTLEHTLLDEYGRAFLATLACKPTRARQKTVLTHMLHEVQAVTDAERADLASAIDEYRDGHLPLTVPARLLLHHLRHEGKASAHEGWFSPWPDSLHLRIEVTHEPDERGRGGARST